MNDVGIEKFYKIKNVDTNFHSHFKDLNNTFMAQRRAKAHKTAERYMLGLKEKLHEKV